MVIEQDLHEKKRRVERQESVDFDVDNVADSVAKVLKMECSSSSSSN